MQEDHKEVSYSKVIVIIVENIRLIIIPTIVFALLSLVYAYFIAEPNFVSSSKVISLSGKNSISQFSNIAAQMGISVPTGSSEPKWAYKEIIESRDILRNVVKSKFSTKKFGESLPLFQILTYGDDEPYFGLDTLEEIAIDILKLEMLSVTDDLITSIVEISVNSNEPELAQKINEKIILLLDAHQRSFNQNQSTKSRKFIQDRIIQTEKELIKAEELLKDFRDSNRRIENSPALLLEQQRLAREVTVLTGVFTTLKQNLETTKIEEVKEQDYIVTIESPNLPLFPSAPRKLLILVGSTILGSLIGLLIVILKISFKNNSNEDKENLKYAQNLISDKLIDLKKRLRLG